MTSSRQLHVTRDGVSYNYVLRSLEPSEIPSWTEFCASVFAYKANPPPASYFARHFFNDPDHDASLIRVAMFDYEIVASCRVFKRRISIGDNAAVDAGGIGEVCTGANHRRRGLSKELLQDCIHIMNSTPSMKVSLLHAAPAFFPVYESAGYTSVVSQWSEVSIDIATLVETTRTDEASSHVVRLACFPQDTAQLMTIHQMYSEKRFAGCIIRSKEYWENYISAELKDSLWVLNSKDNKKNIHGWLSIRPRGERYQVREFGGQSVAVPAVFRLLLRQVLNQKGVTGQSFKLCMPSKVLQEVGKADFITDVKQDDDSGWMYKQLSEDSVSMPDLTKHRPHLI